MLGIPSACVIYVLTLVDRHIAAVISGLGSVVEERAWPWVSGSLVYWICDGGEELRRAVAGEAMTAVTATLASLA